MRNTSFIASVRFLAITLFLVFSACSPGMFSSNSEDSSVTKITQYRKVNAACADMNLESSQISVDTFRSILSCFNSQKGLEEIAVLVNGPKGLKDEQLAPIVNHLNKYILNDQERLFEIESTYRSLVSQGILQDSLEHLGKLLANEDFVTSALALLVDGFFLSSGDQKSFSPDPLLLKSFGLIGERLKPEQVQSYLDLGILMFESRPFRDLILSFKNENIQGKTTAQIVSQLYSYLKGSHTYACSGDERREIKADLIAYVLAAPAGSEPFDLLDRLVGSTPDEMRKRIPEFAVLMNDLLKDQNGSYDLGNVGAKSLFRDMLGAFHDLNGPIHCLNQGASVPSGTRHLISQLAKIDPAQAPVQVLKRFPLDLMAMGPFCELPPNLSDRYQALIALSQTKLSTQGASSLSAQSSSAMVTMVDILSTLHQTTLPWRGCAANSDTAQHLAGAEMYHPLTTFVSNLLADGDPSANTGPSQLISGLIDLSSRKSARATDKEQNDGKTALANLLLTLSLVDQEGRKLLLEEIRFFIVPREELNGVSIADVFLNAVTRNPNPKHLIAFISSLSKFSDIVEPEGKIFGESLRRVRRAYYVNQVHPVLDLLRTTLKDAPQNGEFYASLYAVAQKPELKHAIRSVAEMSGKEDGRLSTLLDSVVSLFHKFAEKGKKPILALKEPLFNRQPSHQLSQEMLLNVSVQRRELEPQKDFQISPECLKMNLNFSIALTDHRDFLPQLNLMLKCQGDLAVESAVKTLVETRIERSRPERSFYEFLVQTVKDFTSKSNPFALTGEDLKFIANSFANQETLGKINRFLRLGNSFISPPEESEVLRPLFTVGDVVLTHSRTSLQRVETFLADEISRPDFKETMIVMDDFLEQAQAIQKKRKELAARRLPSGRDLLDKRIFTEELRQRTRNAVRNYECLTDHSAIERRVDEIVANAKGAVGITELQPGEPAPRQGLPDGKPVSLKDWDFDRIDPFLDSMLTKFGDPVQSMADRSALIAHLNFLKRFRKNTEDVGIPADPNVRPFYRPEYLAQWLYERAIDYQPVPIYEHGCLKVIKSERGQVGCAPGMYYVSPAPKIVLYNSLNRMERLIYEVSFSAPLPPSFSALADRKDLGLDFPQELGQAWLDQDEAERPSEIRGVRPQMNLATAVEDIVDRQATVLGFKTENLSWLSWAVGYPERPACVPSSGWQSGRLRRVIGWIASGPGTDLPAMKARLFNLQQTNQVLRENARRTVDQDGQVQPAGLELIRDLFFEIYYSSPENVRTADYPSAQKYANNLSLVNSSVRMGAMSQMGQFVVYFQPGQPERAELDAFFVSLVKFAGSPSIERLISRVMESTALGAARVERQPTPALSALSVLEAVHGNPESKRAFAQLKASLDLIQNTQEYRQLVENGSARELLDFIEEREVVGQANTSNAVQAKQLASKLRGYLARRLRVDAHGSTDLEQFLFVGKAAPEPLNHSLKTFGDYVTQGKVNQFLEMVQQSLSEAKH